MHVVHGDVLEPSPRAEHLGEPTRALVIGNIPYNITSPIHLPACWTPPAPSRDIVLMVQEEVADRIVAPVGSKAYGALSVGVRAVADARKLFRVGRGAFRPVPGVDSAIIRITPRTDAGGGHDGLRTVVRAAFQWRRKQLRKILRDHPDVRLSDGEEIDRVLAELGVEGTVRPERLSPEQFVQLAAALP